MPVELDDVDRRLLNRYQGGLPVSHRPFAEMGETLGIPEDEVIARIRRLLDAGALSRVGPILNAPQLGGERTLAAMRVPAERFDEVAALVNSLDTVSHNYEREHELNMWFVISSDDPEAIERTIATIERETGLPVVNLPTLEEFFVDLRFEF
jgi:DNA-binding Lrp family transcriptional regulator